MRPTVNDMICTRSSKSQRRAFAVRSSVLKEALSPKSRKRNHESISTKDATFKRRKSSEPPTVEKANSGRKDATGERSNSSRSTMTTRNSRKRVQEELKESSSRNGKATQRNVGNGPTLTKTAPGMKSEISGNGAVNDSKSRIPIEDSNNVMQMKMEEKTEQSTLERCLMKNMDEVDSSAIVKIGKNPYTGHPFRSKQYLEDLSRRSSKMMLLQEIIVKSDHFVCRPEVFSRGSTTKNFFSCQATLDLFSYLTGDTEFFSYQREELRLSSVGLVRKSYATAFERRLSSYKAAANEGGISGRTRRRRRERLVEALAACQSPAFPPDDEDTDPCGLTDTEEEEEQEKEEGKEEPKEEPEDKVEVAARPWRSRRANGKQLLQWKFCYEPAVPENSGRRDKGRSRKEEKEEKVKEEKKTKDAKDARCSRLSPSSFSVNLPPGTSAKSTATVKKAVGAPANDLSNHLRSNLSKIVSKAVRMDVALNPFQAHLSNVSTDELHGVLVATMDTPFVVLNVTKQEASDGPGLGLRYNVMVGLRENEEKMEPSTKKKATSNKEVEEIKQKPRKEEDGKPKSKKEEIRRKSEKEEDRKPKSKKEEIKQKEKEERKKKTEKEEGNRNTEKEEKIGEPDEERKEGVEQEEETSALETIRSGKYSPERETPSSLPESSPEPKTALKATPGRFLVKAMCLQPRASRPSPYSDSSDEEMEEAQLDPDVQERMQEMQQPIKSVVNSQGLRDAQRRIRHRKTDPDIHPVTRLYNSRLKACRTKETGAAAVAKILKRAVLLDRRTAPRLPPPPDTEARQTVAVSCVSFPPPKVQVDNRGRFVDPFRRDQHTPATALTASERLKLLKSSGPGPVREDSPPRSLGVVIEEVKDSSSQESSVPSVEDTTDLILSPSPENVEIEDPGPDSPSESQECVSRKITTARVQCSQHSSIRVVTQPMQTFTNSPIKLVRPCTLSPHSVKVANQTDSPNARPPGSGEVINLSSSPTLSSSSSVQMMTQSSSSAMIPQSSSPAKVTQSSSSVKVTQSSNSVKVIGQSSSRVKVINQSSSRVKVISQSSNLVKKTSLSSSPIKLIGQSSSRVKVISQSSSPTKTIEQDQSNFKQQTSNTTKVMEQSSGRVKLIGQSSGRVKLIGQSSSRVKLIGQSSNRVKLIGQSSSRVKVIDQSSSRVKLISRPMSSSSKVVNQTKTSPVESVNQSKPSIVKVISQGTTSPIKMISQSQTSPVKVISQSKTTPVKVISQSTTGPVKVINQTTVSPVKVINQSTVSPVKVISQSTLSSEKPIQNVDTQPSALTLTFATPPRVSRAISLVAGHHVANSIDAIRVPTVQVLSPVGVGVTTIAGSVRPLTSVPNAVPTALSARPLVRDKSAGFRRILPRPAACEGERAAPRPPVTVSNPDVRQISAIQRRASDPEEAKSNVLPERQVARLKAMLQQNIPQNATPVVKTGSGSPKLTAVNSVDSLRVPPASSYAAVPPSPKCNTEYAPSAIRISMTRVRRLDDDEKSNESVKDN